MNHRVILLTALFLSAAALPATEPFLEKQDLFTVGEDPAYNIYHIPGIVVTAKGTVLAWCEARKGGGDWSDIRILLRRSTDDGKAWSAPQSIADVPGPKTKNAFALRLKNVDTSHVTYNNPVFIADRDGAVHMLFCLEPVWMQTGEAAGFAATLAVKGQTTPAQLDPDLLVRKLVTSHFMITFFNDIDVAVEDPRILAAQYFDAKGFFVNPALAGVAGPPSGPDPPPAIRWSSGN